MGLIWNRSRKARGERDMLQKAISLMEDRISENNQLTQALFSLVSKGQTLTKDSNLDQYVDKGYQGNPDIFGILMKLANKFASVPYKLVTVQPDGTEVDAQNPEVEALLKQPNYYQSYTEFKRAWFLYKYTTGSAIVYAPKYENGINVGKVNQDGLSMFPTQNMSIHTGGDREPIDYYTLDLNQSYQIQTEDVWHERITNLNQLNGENFMGISPLKTAKEQINILNSGASLTSGMYHGGHPPGILAKETEGTNESLPKDQEEAFRKHYKRKYLSNPEDSKVPVFTMGKIQWVKIGYDSIRDLQVIEMSVHGVRVLCRVLGVAPQLFGDTESSTYNNMQEAQTAMWEDLLVPEINSFYEGLNDEIICAYGENLKAVPVFDKIPALQKDIKHFAEVYDIGVKNGSYSLDEFREKLGDAPLGTVEMQQHYISANMFPINGDEDISIEESNKFYKDNDMNDKL